MEYIIYALAAAGVHNIWLYQDICRIPRDFLNKFKPWTKFLLCPPCFMMWALIGMCILGPYIYEPLVYAIAAYPILLFYLSFKQAFSGITKKYELYLDNKIHNERQNRLAGQVVGRIDEQSGNTYKESPGSKIIRAEDFTPPAYSSGERAEDNGCVDCDAAKEEKKTLAGK